MCYDKSMNKKLLGIVSSLSAVVFLVGVAGFTLASAQSIPQLSLSAVGPQAPFQVGESWTLTLSSNMPNQPVSICGEQNSNQQTCTPFGTTDADGNWTDSGTFGAGTAGTWKEWIQFTNSGVQSTEIDFSVANAPAPTISCYANDNCNTIQGQICFNPGQTSSYCGLPGGSGVSASNSGSQSISQILSAAGHAGVCQGDVIHSASDAQNCETLFLQQADALGYTSSQCAPLTLENYGAASANPYYISSCTLSGNGVLGAAPSCAVTPYLVSGAAIYGDVSGSWGSIANGQLSAECSLSSGVPGATTGSTGTTSGTGGTTSGSTGLTTGTGGTTGSTAASNPIASALQNSGLSSSGWSSINQILSTNNAGIQGNTSGGSTGSASASAGSSSGGSTAGGSCTSVASATIANSLQTLQSIATVLSAGNVSQGILTSVQNLINAVAQVIAALAGCITTQNAGPVSIATPTTTATVAISCDPPVGCSYLSRTATSCGPETCSPTTTTPVITSIAPTSGAINSVVTVQGTGFTATGDTINLISTTLTSVVPNLTSPNGQTLTFSVPTQYRPACSYVSGTAVLCSFPTIPTAPGVYEVSVTNANGTSNLVSFTVTS